MNKFLTIFGVSFQKQLEVRSEFFFERSRSVSVLFSLYFLWTALLSSRESVGGYNLEQIITYVFMMTLLRAWVLACVTDQIPMEIAKGNLSDLLLRPISAWHYWASQDAANKTLNITAAVLEMSVFAIIVRPPFFVPFNPVTWIGFVAATLAGMILYFQMSFMLGVLGFWTAQSWGPRFCFEILLEFCAGAYFPIDILPQAAQRVLAYLPFPYLIFHPLSIYLEKETGWAILRCLMMQAFWIGIFSLLLKFAWGVGLRKYGAEGR